MMSVNVTTTTPVNIPPNGGMRGVPPTIFDGTWSCADDFWGQFQRFKLVNRTHEAMKIPFDQVLMALTYMCGPLINDWVDQQEKKLADWIDMSKRNWVHEDNETLWSEFEMAFLTAWTDTSKKQNVYDQLMHLTMSGWDVDTYITTFDRLALAAGWDLDLEGTITKFRKGLSKGVHSKAPSRNGKQLHEQKWHGQKKNIMWDLPEINAETPRNLEHTQVPRHHHVLSWIQTILASFRWKSTMPQDKQISKS